MASERKTVQLSAETHERLQSAKRRMNKAWWEYGSGAVVPTDYGITDSQVIARLLDFHERWKERVRKAKSKAASMKGVENGE